MFTWIFEILGIICVFICVFVQALDSKDLNKRPAFGTYTPQFLKLSLHFPEEIESRQYTGDMELTFSLLSEISVIELDSMVSEVSGIQVFGDSKLKDMYVKDVYNKSEAKIYIYLSEPLRTKVSYTLHMKFVSELRTDYTGFYIVSYLNSNKDIEYLVSSKFKPKHAKKAFPFWDEAGIRANFYLSITHQEEFYPVFNVKERTTNRTENRTLQTTFSQTYLLPIYQFSLSLVKFNYVSTHNGPQNEIHGANSCHDKFSLETCKLLRPEMRKFFKFYFVSRYDILKVPTDAEITSDDALATAIFREQDIEVDDLDTSEIDRVKAALRIGRAFAHNYFGGSLCLSFWSELWLNDGFARWLAYKIIQKIYPDWSMDQFFMVFEYQSALLSESSIPISLTIKETEDQFKFAGNEEQNTIYTAKASSFVRMLEYYSSPESFQAVLIYYADKYDTNIVNSEIFFDTLLANGNFSKISFPSLMSWISLSGYPLLTITRNYSSGAVRFTRSSFPDITMEHRCWLPLNVITADDPDFSRTCSNYSMTPNTSELLLSAKEVGTYNNDKWLVLNAQQTGYLRTNYDMENWKLIMQALYDDHTVIHVNNRAQLLDDSFRLAQLDILPFEVSLNLSLYISHEKEFAPWATAHNLLSSLEWLLEDEESYSLFNFYVQRLTQPIYVSIGLNETNQEPIILKASRSIISYWACKTWNPNCYCAALKLYEEYLNTNQLISPNIRETILCTGISTASRKELDLTFTKFLQSKSINQRLKLMHLLGCSRDEHFLAEWLKQIFQMTLFSGDYKPEWTKIIPEIVKKGPHGLLAAINTLKVKAHQQLLSAEIALFPSLKSIARSVYSDYYKNMFFPLLVDLLEKNLLSSEQFDELTIEVLKNIGWAEKNRPTVLNWLRGFKEAYRGSYVEYSYKRQPPCDALKVTDSCGCGCACEDGAKNLFPSTKLTWFLISILFLANHLSIKKI